MDGILSLKWNNHLTVLFNTLSSLHKKDLYSDVTLACGGQFFPVHKLVLSACSEFFEELFKQTPCSHPVVILKDIQVGDLEALLSYMYLGEANVSQSDLARLIKAAECLCIKGLAVPDEGGPGPGQGSGSSGGSNGSSSSSSGKRPHPNPSEDTHHSKRRKTDTTTASATSSRSDSGEGREGCGQVEAVHPPHHSPDDDGGGGLMMSNATQDLAEVVIEEHPIVKEEEEEPSCDPEVEAIIARGARVTRTRTSGDSEDDDCITQVGASLNFAELNSDEGGDGSDGGGGGGGGVGLYEHHLAAAAAAAATHPASGVLQDLMVPGIAGPSADIGGWDSMAGFSLEGLHSEDSRSSQTLEYLGAGSSSGGPTSVVEEAAAAAAVTLSCPYCQRTFTYRSDLNRHIRSHTGEKPYTCCHCDYRATQKSHLNEHIKRRHPHLS